VVPTATHTKDSGQQRPRTNCRILSLLAPRRGVCSRSEQRHLLLSCSSVSDSTSCPLRRGVVLQQACGGFSWGNRACQQCLQLPVRGSGLTEFSRWALPDPLRFLKFRQSEQAKTVSVLVDRRSAVGFSPISYVGRVPTPRLPHAPTRSHTSEI